MPFRKNFLFALIPFMYYLLYIISSRFQTLGKTNQNVMPELEEFAEALLDQLSVEINEEREISELVDKIAEDASFKVKFDDIEQICSDIFPQMALKVKEFLGI